MFGGKKEVSVDKIDDRKIAEEFIASMDVIYAPKFVYESWLRGYLNNGGNVDGLFLTEFHTYDYNTQIPDSFLLATKDIDFGRGLFSDEGPRRVIIPRGVKWTGNITNFVLYLFDGFKIVPDTGKISHYGDLSETMNRAICKRIGVA